MFYLRHSLPEPRPAIRYVVIFLLLSTAFLFAGGCDFGGSGGQYQAQPTDTGSTVAPATATAAPPTVTQAPTATQPPLSAQSLLTPTLPPTPVSAYNPEPSQTPSSSVPTFQRSNVPTPKRPTPTPTPAMMAQREAEAPNPTPVVIDGRSYDAYVPAATKTHQVYHYSCEFDAAWVVLATYGFDVSLDEQLAIVGVDTSIEPYYKETDKGFIVYGGDIIDHYSGDYKTNFLARTTGFAMRRVFEYYGFTVTPVQDRESLEAALRRGELVWIKTTADFKPGKPVTWIMPDGRTYNTVLGNDHAAVVMGYNSDGVLIRDVLGPTSTNWQRKYQYEVPWPKFLAAWASQQYDGLAVAPTAK